MQPRSSVWNRETTRGYMVKVLSVGWGKTPLMIECNPWLAGRLRFCLSDHTMPSAGVPVYLWRFFGFVDSGGFRLKLLSHRLGREMEMCACAFLLRSDDEFLS